MNINNFVRTEHNWSPRGDCYDWCKLEEDGTLTFGDEQGNYDGGQNLTVTFFNGKTAQDYIHEVEKRLELWKTKDEDFYNKIIAMMNENCVTLDDVLHHAIAVRGE